MAPASRQLRRGGQPARRRGRGARQGDQRSDRESRAARPARPDEGGRDAQPVDCLHSGRYGAHETKPPHGWDRPGSPFTYLDTREWAIGYFSALGKGYLKISQNPNAGSGGTCYGDSGGPQFLGGPESNLQVSVTVTGDVFCKSTNAVQRLDIFQVQSWLSQFVSIG